MEKRTLLALAITFLFLISYPAMLEKFYPQKTSSPVASNTVSSPALSNAVSSPALPGSSKGRFSPEGDVDFKTSKLHLRFNKEGGVIRELSFLDFMDSHTKKPLQFLSLVSEEAAPGLLYLTDDASSAEIFSPHKISSAVPNKISVEGVQRDLRISKNFVFEDHGYSAKLEVSFQNLSDSPRVFRYQLFAGPSIVARHSIDGQYLEANFYHKAEKNKLQHLKESKAGKKVESRGPVEWVATKDRHFSIIIKPLSETDSFDGLVEGLGDHRFRVALVSPTLTVAGKSELKQNFLVYMGPNDVKELEPLGLGNIVNFGKLDIIGKLLVGSLELIHGIVRNYGLAIILLTFLINVLLFPLTRVSYLSMKRMQLVQPHMNKIKDQHKNNPQKLNKEMMELYKKHKVNPFGGCLPMVLQMPVFLALYVALSKDIILINSKLLWIKDLSSPDSVSLPMSLPFLGDQIHVLPLIMCAAMVIQQKFTQIKMDGQDPAVESQQKMMAIMMPIIFGFIFYTMPSGLVLYWLTNTLIMTWYQLRLKRMTLAS